MRAYELMIVFDPGVDPTDSKKIDTLSAKFLGESAGFIKNKEIIGKKKLNYSINKKLEGVYVLVKLEAPKVDYAYMTRQIKLMPEIMRFLLTVVNR